MASPGQEKATRMSMINQRWRPRMETTKISRGRVGTLETMSDALRIPLMLRDGDGLSYDEIAEQLGISLSAVKMRIKRAREEFRRRFAALMPGERLGSPPELV